MKVSTPFAFLPPSLSPLLSCCRGLAPPKWNIRVWIFASSSPSSVVTAGIHPGTRAATEPCTCSLGGDCPQVGQARCPVQVAAAPRDIYWASGTCRPLSSLALQQGGWAPRSTMAGGWHDRIMQGTLCTEVAQLCKGCWKLWKALTLSEYSRINESTLAQLTFPCLCICCLLSPKHSFSFLFNLV